MKHVVVLLLGLCYWGAVAVRAQSVYVSRHAKISFYSSAPIEDIEAKTDEAVSAINPGTGAIFVKVPIVSFQFDHGMMQDHFNSDYLESDKYPYAEFEGKIDPLPPLAKDGTYQVTVAGQLTIHGVTKPYQGPGTVVVKNNQMVATSAFTVRLADHGIKIPTLLTKNIAEEVDVKVDATYQQQKEAAKE